MNQTLASDARTVLTRLHELADASSTPPPNVDTARDWAKAIKKSLGFLEDPAHSVVFIGNVGVGKSSLISVLAHLLVGSAPADRQRLKDHSVLAIGSGRTTVCEVRIRARHDGDAGQIGLVVEPFSLEDMRKEIEFYAHDEWTRRQTDARRRVEDDTDPTSQEVHRAIRGMTDYAERQETYLDGGLKRRRNVRPLDEVIPQFSTPALFADHLLGRAKLSTRIKTSWWWETSTQEDLKKLKALFEAVNQGTEPSAMLPERMTVVVPEPLPGSMSNLALTLIDTRGLDGKVESRSDLQELLRDPRSVSVLCAPFKDAPGESLRALVRSMAGDAELRQAAPRALLILIDQGDGEQVNGARGDREFGQELKIDECHIALESTGAPQMIEKVQILAFDALKDDRQRLLDAISDRLVRLRQSQEDALRQQIADARNFLVSDKNHPVLRESVDKQIQETLAQHLLSDAPMHDPLAGVYNAIIDCRYASVVYATCRRNGTYSRLDAYAAIRAEANRAATVWLDDLIRAVTSKLDTLLQDPNLATLQDHIRLRQRQFQEGQIRVIRDYAEQVGKQVEELLKPSPVWSACREEWSRGHGFKARVLAHLEGWARQQPGLTAHERTNAMQEIPLVGEIARPVRAPRFTLHARNLRALRQANWAPEPVSALIGANGAGKTTLLQTLRLLRVAYELGLPEAVRTVLGGSSNLKFWGAPDSEPVEIGLDIEEASWRIALIPREGAVDYMTNERFTEGTREIFSRDTLGNFSYGGERLDPSPQTGLRVLMDRGVHEPALRRMASFLKGIAVYHDPDLWTLRMLGSSTTEDRYLHSRSTNALTLLRRWHQERGSRDRYQFVIDGLNSAFPHTVSDLDFVEAGNTLVARVYRPGMELPSPLENEANGVLQLLVLFCNVAAAKDGSVVAIDEPENSLHPYALRRFLSRTSRWAKQHNLTVLLATHSTVLLDELSSHPEQVYVLKALSEGEPVPTRLDQLCDRDWLAGFKLGDLYEQGEIGSNEDEA
ncbi:AAA family ATPase [Myxococcus llanfairpwllgwyngyllgogerychwyrndrobwllllantysiliogogogochensis]|nr:AAA family ATPase [Myxococcus llanfairpwllgwyngyllgogerychwyrndrobwllllantysiliogogogochensis]